MQLTALTERVINGENLAFAEILWAGENCALDDLLAAAEKITVARAARTYDLCCIQNAKSGRCSGDCRWCAQAARYDCAIETYDLVEPRSALDNLEHARRKKIQKFALVTSGETLAEPDFTRVLALYRELATQGGAVELCGSLGLLNREQLAQLKAAGLQNYHCNLEAAPSFFSQVCTTHSLDDKRRTLRAARAAGLKLCCGGIIGMGESFAQRVELALAVAEFAPPSIPLNVLDPIAGTPLGNLPPLDDDSFLRAVAVFRFANPASALRFAGGRAHFSRETIARAMRAGVNSAITEGLLTTRASASAAEDHAAFQRYYRAPTE